MCRSGICPNRVLPTVDAEGAARETWEEANCQVEILAPYSHFDIPVIGQAYILFRCTCSALPCNCSCAHSIALPLPPVPLMYLHVQVLGDQGDQVSAHGWSHACHLSILQMLARSDHMLHQVGCHACCRVLTGTCAALQFVTTGECATRICWWKQRCRK